MNQLQPSTKSKPSSMAPCALSNLRLDLRPTNTRTTPGPPARARRLLPGLLRLNPRQPRLARPSLRPRSLSGTAQACASVPASRSTGLDPSRLTPPPRSQDPRPDRLQRRQPVQSALHLGPAAAPGPRRSRLSTAHVRLLPPASCTAFPLHLAATKRGSPRGRRGTKRVRADRDTDARPTTAQSGQAARLPGPSSLLPSLRCSRPTADSPRWTHSQSGKEPCWKCQGSGYKPFDPFTGCVRAAGKA